MANEKKLKTEGDNFSKKRISSSNLRNRETLFHSELWSIVGIVGIAKKCHWKCVYWKCVLKELTLPTQILLTIAADLTAITGREGVPVKRQMCSYCHTTLPHKA